MTGLKVPITYENDKSSLDGAISDLKSGFEEVGKSLGDNLSSGLNDFTKDAGKSIQKSLGSSILDGTTSGLDSIGDVWESAWKSLGKSAKNALASALGGLTVDGIGSLFKSSDGSSSTGTTILSKALGFYTDPKKANEATSWVKDTYNSLFGSGKADEASKLPSGIGDFLDFTDTETLTQTTNELVAGGNNLPSGVNSFMDFGGGGDWGAAFSTEAGTELAAGAEGISEGAFGLSAGATAGLAIAAPFAVGELASMLGLMEGPSPLSAIFGNGGGHTQESAQETISANMDYLAEAAQVLQTALEGANTGATNFATTMMTQMSGATLEMGRLAERAGMSEDEISAMIEALDPASAKLITASESVALVNEKIDSMDNVLEQSIDSFSGANTAASEFEDMLLSMADSMDLPAESSETLTTSIKSLVAQWDSGQISAETLSTSLKTSFTTALTDLATQTSTTTEQMKALADSIESIPTEWTSTINVVYNTVGDEPAYQHSGGLLMHDGGWLGGLPRYHAGARVSPLFNDEVPIIAQQGEFIVRRDSVNAATLPLLKALNQGGNGVATAPPQVNLHLEVHGNLMGDESAFNDLARLLEAKLMDLNQARYAA